jgi:uncharacterized protein YacL
MKTGFEGFDPVRGVIRFVLVALGALIGYVIAPKLVSDGLNQTYIAILGALITSLLTTRLANILRQAVANITNTLLTMPPQTVLAATIATIMALLISVLLNNVLSSIPGYAWYFQLLITALLEVFLVSVAVLNRDVFTPFASRNLVIERKLPALAPSIQKLLDTSVIIDGRILEVAQSGFLEGTLIVPGFVLRELQYFADQTDSQKRAKGRRGLEVLEKLRANRALELVIREFEDTGGGVDDRLVRAAQEINASVLTNDTGLSRVAGLQGVTCLSLNALAEALKPRYGAGDELTIAVVKEGSQPGQGVGFLEDGTMVVIDDGLALKGRTVRVAVISATQTSLGRMIFGKPKEVL